MSSIQEVAQRAGVSIATVSRTFSAPNLINEHTQKRVLEAARELDYQPRRARAAGTTGVRPATLANAIGFQFFGATPADTLHTNTFYMPVLAGAQAEAASLGLHLLLHATDRHSLSVELPRMALERAVGGMLLVGTADPSVLSRFAQHVPHIVLVDNRDETGMYESVVSDGFSGALAATRYLMELGHRRIAYFLSEPGIVTFQDRLRGYQCALREAGMATDPDLVVMDNSAEQSAKSLTHLLTSPDPPTALLTANDYCAFQAIRVCRSIDLRIPDDISLIGFDDIPFSMHTDVPLTTMHVDKEAMGRLAVRRLYTRMQAEVADNCPPVCNLLPVSLVARQSCHAVVDTCHAVTSYK